MTGNGDDYLEEFEKAQIYIDLYDIYKTIDEEDWVNTTSLKPNDVVLIEIRPPEGAGYPIELKVPPTIDKTMVLLQ
ncbi:MAG TPA: hypothetical protein EYH00_02335 [Archaeoglobus profundus]|nr:hypothetical protein [Archaeoglobus profundus]